MNKNNTIEVNGPATILMLLDLMYETKRINKHDYDLLTLQTNKTMDYLMKLDNPNGIMWHNLDKKKIA